MFYIEFLSNSVPPSSYALIIALLGAFIYTNTPHICLYACFVTDLLVISHHCSCQTLHFDATALRRRTVAGEHSSRAACVPLVCR